MSTTETTEGAAVTGSREAGHVVAPGEGAAPTSTAPRCPKCRRPTRHGESACARCGLLVARFAGFIAAESRADESMLDSLWTACRRDWSAVAVHDRIIDHAARGDCLPLLARRYRERLESGPDAVAERRLQQLAVLIETAVRAQARDGGSRGAIRTLWFLGYSFAATVLALSAWVFMIALQRR